MNLDNGALKSQCSRLLNPFRGVMNVIEYGEAKGDPVGIVITPSPQDNHSMHSNYGLDSWW